MREMYEKSYLRAFDISAALIDSAENSRFSRGCIAAEPSDSAAMLMGAYTSVQGSLCALSAAQMPQILRAGFGRALAGAVAAYCWRGYAEKLRKLPARAADNTYIFV